MGNITPSPPPAPPAGPPAPPGDAPHPWRRFVALGDSFTEGIGDPDPGSPGGHRGWADRVAEELGRLSPGFSYANLAIRGRLLQRIADEQVGPALQLRPDLVSICGGGNDVLRPGGDPDALAVLMDDAVGRLGSGGATVLLFTGPDIGRTPVLGARRGRVAVYNENLRIVAARHGAVVADLWGLRELHEPAMWAEDRLHFSPLGHHTIARMVLDVLGVPHGLEPLEVAPPAPRTWRQARREDLVWARMHLAPWVIRGLRHRSTGDGITPKRPLAAPLETGTVGAGHPEAQDPSGGGASGGAAFGRDASAGDASGAG